MAGKINVFNLGALGVDLVKSPLHMADGAWRSLQNAEFNPDHSQGGIKKRGALTAFTPVALGGTIKSIANVPLPINTESFLMVAMNAGETETFKKSETGAVNTFTDVLSAEMPRYLGDPNALLVTWDLIVAPSVQFKRALYYPGDDYIRHNDTGFTDPPLIVYTPDEQAYTLIRIPPNPTDPTGACIAITCMCVMNGRIYFGTADSGGVAPNSKGRVFELDPGNGSIVEIGNRFGDDTGENTHGFPACICNFQGRLWVGTYGSSGNNQGRVYSINPGIDETWTTELTGTLHNGYIHSLAAYNGKLYAATDADSSGTAIVQERAANGTWSTSFSAPSSNVSRFTGLIAFADLLFVGWRGNGDVDCLIKRFNGSAWTTDLDVKVAFSSKPVGMPFIFKGNLYWPFASGSITAGTDGFLLQRAGGAWSAVIAAAGLRGAVNKFLPET